MKKIKRFLAFFMIIVYVGLIGTPNITVNACSVTGTTPNITIDGVRWHVNEVYDDTTVYLYLCKIETSEDDIELRFPTYEECYNKWSTLGSGYRTSYNITKVDRLRFCGFNDSLERVKSVVINEGYKVFPNDLSRNTSMFRDNTSIEKITVDTNNSEDFEICEATFANMSGLKEVNMNVGTRNLTLDGSVFANCVNLEKVTLTGNVSFGGSFNFAGCKNLKSIEVNGTLVVDGTQDFSGCENLKYIGVYGNATFNGANTFTDTTAKNSTLEAKFDGRLITSSKLLDGPSYVAKTSIVAQNLLKSGVVSENVSGTKAVFAGCKNISTISINGKGNTVNANFIANATSIGNLNIEGGTTTFAENSIVNSTINGISFNASTKVGKGALNNCKVENMYFNTSDVTSSGNSNDGAIGKNNTKVANMYFNHYDFFRNSDKVTSLENVPLGTGDYSLNCDNIYFLSPNFNKINQSPYSSKTITNVYGYGGTLATYNEGNSITAKEMFEQWKNGNNNNYHNIVQLTSPKDRETTETKTLYVEKEDGKAVFDLSSLNVKAMYNKDIKNVDQLPTDEAGNVRQGEFSLKYTKDPKASTNFNYKVLKEATGASANGQYTYTANGKTYITCQEDKLELGVSKDPYRFYVQAAGETWPLDVVVEQNTVNSLSVSINKEDGAKDGKLHLTVGDDLNQLKEYITVTAKLANGKDTVLSESQYTVVKTDLSNTPATAQDTTLLVYHQESGATVKLENVQIHEDKVASFDLACSKTDMPIGGQITLEDMTLTNIAYDNPLTQVVAKLAKPTADADYAYRFLQDGQETDVYTIQEGVNTVSVIYQGCVQEVEVNGVSNKVKDYTISCDVKDVELYQKSTLDISEVMLENVVYAEECLSDLERSIVDSGFKFVVNGQETDTVKLEDGDNTIRVRYNGLDKTFTVKAYAQSVDRIDVSYCGPAVYEGCEVPKDTQVLLVTVYYKHPYEASVLLSNFEVSYDTYHIVPGEDNEIYVRYKGVRSVQPIRVKGLADGLKSINKVEYRGATTKGTKLKKEDFYVELGYLSGKTVTSEENPAILEKLSLSSNTLVEGENNIKVVYDGGLTEEVKVKTNSNPKPTESASPQPPTESPKVSGSTATPQVTVSPSNAPAGPTVTLAPQGTNAPVVAPTASPVVQPQKGSSITVQGVKYKVTAVTEQGGSVSVTGYDKKASKVKLQTTVSLDGYQYKVTKIEKRALENCQTLKGNVNIPYYVTDIGDKAFYKCKKITKVVMGKELKTIGTAAFQYCTNLKVIDLANCTLKKVEKKAFFNNHKKRKFKMNSPQISYYRKLLKKKKQYN